MDILNLPDRPAVTLRWSQSHLSQQHEEIRYEQLLLDT